MRTALDEEVLLRGRAIATIGPESILGDLRGVARWEEPVLSLPKSRESRLNAAGRRLLLVPTLFADQHVTCSTDHPAVLRLTYQSRGAAVLAPTTQRVTAPGPDRFGRLIGERRALIMRALTTPATTSGLATVLGLPASTVSEQLAALHEAGVLYRRRAGRQVYYGLEPTGHALLAMFDPATLDPATANRFPS
jgi:DNA-binding transcriptional ArsR family regulator